MRRNALTLVRAAATKVAEIASPAKTGPFKRITVHPGAYTPMMPGLHHPHATACHPEGIRGRMTAKCLASAVDGQYMCPFL